MKSLWDDKAAAKCKGDPLALRVYSSRLIGTQPNLVLHGGGNTSVKATVTDAFGDDEEILYVKGSGWDLATIEAEGFAPVRLDVLKRMAELPDLSDSEMVRMQRAAMIDPNAPTPSVEAILHAIIPFRFVDHTHADAVVTITNTPDGMERIGEIYGDNIFIVPYLMPGFVLAREIYDQTRDVDWGELEAMILLNHGVFTFGDDARSSYERMIQIVTQAEDYLDAEAPMEKARGKNAAVDELHLARLRRAVSNAAGFAMTTRVDSRPAATAFSSRDDVASITGRGPLTPDHIIRTRRTALVVGDEVEDDVARWSEAYREYFDRHTDGSLTCLDVAPRWAVWPGTGTVALGRGDREAAIVADIVAHTTVAIERAEKLGAWETVDESDLFEIEYWELEQAKLARAGSPPPLSGHVALVTGAASGIGRACVEKLHEEGACVAALDIDASVEKAFRLVDVSGIRCDVTDPEAVAEAVRATVRRFGGVDIVVSNAGTFPATETIRDMANETWEKSLAVNLSGHRNILQKCVPLLELGIDPAVVIVGSKNVIAPGPGRARTRSPKRGSRSSPGWPPSSSPRWASV